MPLVSATGYPYSPAPTQSPSPTTGTPTENIAGATPEAFGYGIGQAESKLGATAEEAGNRLADRAIEQQQLTNNIAANNSTNYFMDEANKILHGDPNKPGDVGFYGLKGLDAVNARQSTVQNIDNLMQSARSQLRNPRQLLAFDSETRRQRSFLLNDVGRHYDQQLTQSAINSATAGMNLAGQGMSVAAANQDWDAFNHKVEDYMTGAIKHNQAVGGTQEMLDVEFQKIRGIATKQWVESLVEKNPTQARDFLEVNKDALVPDELFRLRNMVRAGADKAEINQSVFGPPKNAAPTSPSTHINYGGTGALGNPNEPGWAEKNLTTIQSPSGVPFKVNKAAAADFTGFLKDLEATGYKPEPEQSGGHALRNMRGGHDLSEHAYGAAIDINWNNNAYSKEGKLSTDLPANIAEIAAAHNLEWGGNWHDPVDAMHFQWRGPQGGTATADNNLGGIRRPGTPASKAAGGFETYATPEQGVQAISDKLSQYAAGGVTTATNPTGAPLNTLRGIVSTWAPPNENDTPGLIARASQVTGFDPDQVLDVSNPDVKAKLIEATIRNEQGGRMPINPAIIQKVAGGPDQLIRPLPLREINELPDTSLPGAYFPDGRGGGMTLTQKIQQLTRDEPNNNEHDALMFAAKVKAARAYANGQYADQQHAHRMQQEADKENDQALMTQYQQRMTGNNPNYPTVDEVLGDKRWKDPAAQRQIVGFIERESKQDPAAAQSKIHTNELYTRMNLPEGTPQRINNENDINNSYIAGDVTRQDHDWLVKQFRDSRSAGGETFAKLRAEFIRMVAEPQIKGADPQYDNLWGERLFQYQSKLDNDIKRYEDAGKNKFDLFDPSKPDYAGRSDFIGWYRSKMFSSFKDAPDASLPIAPIDLDSPDKVKAAYESHKVTWDQASDALQKLGHPLRQTPIGSQAPVR